MFVFKEPLRPDRSRLRIFREQETPYAFSLSFKTPRANNLCVLNFSDMWWTDDLPIPYISSIFFFFTVTSVITNCVFNNFHKFDVYFLPSISLFLLRISIVFYLDTTTRETLLLVFLITLRTVHKKYNISNCHKTRHNFLKVRHDKYIFRENEGKFKK